MLDPSFKIFATWRPALISCKIFLSSFSGRDWCLAAWRISKEFSRTVTSCLIWPLYRTRAGMRLLVASLFRRCTHSVWKYRS